LSMSLLGFVGALLVYTKWYRRASKETAFSENPEHTIDEPAAEATPEGSGGSVVVPDLAPEFAVSLGGVPEAWSALRESLEDLHAQRKLSDLLLELEPDLVWGSSI